MDMELSEDQVAFAQAAKEFALGELAPHAARWDQEAIFPIETIKLAGRMGFGAMYASPEIGGLGLPFRVIGNFYFSIRGQKTFTCSVFY